MVIFRDQIKKNVEEKKEKRKENTYIWILAGG